jgi:sarcosine oxidase subunit gamma
MKAHHGAPILSVKLVTLETRRWGVKGPQAAAWLHEQHVILPHAPNSWLLLGDDPGNVILRLGSSEFFIEEHELASDRSRCQMLAEELFEPVPGVYPVLREDVSLRLTGADANVLLSEAGSFDFASLPAASQQVVMTLLLGISVIVIAQGDAAARGYRIWCDPSYGAGLYSALSSIAADLQ